MSFPKRIAEFSVHRYKLITIVMVLAALLVAAAAVLPSIWPETGKALNTITVDTDPENMLSPKEPVRVFHNAMKKKMSLHDMIVVGVVNEQNPNGVFNPESLQKIYELTKYALELHGDKIGEPEGQGVLPADVIAPSTVDSVEHIGGTGPQGTIDFQWLMKNPPTTQAQADEVRRLAMRVPFLKGTLVSEDGKAVAIYLPITQKDLSHKIYVKLQEETAKLGGPEQFYITGLPVAEDTFGYEMFVQMAISAPAAMVVIFLLMLVFFRKLLMVISPMIVAMVSVIITMGTLVISGFPIHIMSSMIPIFIMPIAVLDSIHIISEFFEKYQATRDRRKTILAVMDELFMPMLYTSLTTMAGFASLALTPIPPVQIFGLFVALGVGVAWILTVTFVPAFVMFIPERKLENFGAKHAAADSDAEVSGRLGAFLRGIGGATYRRAKLIVAAGLIVFGLAIYGITQININDNPIRWFEPSHPIRVADKVLNDHFGGTYMAYLAIRPDEKFDAATFAEEFAADATAQGKKLKDRYPAAPKVFAELGIWAKQAAGNADSRSAFFAELGRRVDTAREPSEPKPAPPSDGAPAVPGNLSEDTPAVPGGLGESAKADKTNEQTTAAWNQAFWFLDEQQRAGQVFKQPTVLRYIEGLQQAMGQFEVVGKTNSLVDIVKTVNRDVLSGKPADYRLPDTAGGVVQMLDQYQSSHRRHDLWHFVTKDYRTVSIWTQLRSGDNQDMSRVVQVVSDYIRKHPPPQPLKLEWFGLTYINVIWQEKMVTGMLQSFAGSFLVVLLMMTILFRSLLWGLLSMIPLTLTIATIYGAMGFIGKDYDMPVAVLSSLTLGMAVDFAIHFLARARVMYTQYGNWRDTAPAVFGEPALAIARNIIVIASGFLPLLLAPLVPYQTVGIFLATILLVSGIATLLLLPAMMRLLEKRLFRPHGAMGVGCNCVACVASAVILTAIIAINLYQFFEVPIMTLTWISLVAVPVLAGVCGLLSRRDKCRLAESAKQGETS